MFNKVFISYASEDLETANKLYDFLEESGFEPWLDKRKLLPGQKWEYQILRALKVADFVVILLSSNSVSKRGYFQKEFKLSLDYCEEKLDSDTYIIPCKIDECEIPDKLRKFQWVEFADDEFYKRLLLSLKDQRIKYEGQYSPYKYEMKKEREFIEGKPNLIMDFEYPSFQVNNAGTLIKVNEFLKGYFIKKSLDFKNTHINFVGMLNDYYTDVFQPSDYFMQLVCNVHLATKDYLSLSIFHYYFEGGAHGNYFDRGFSFRLNPFVSFSIGDIFDHNADILKWISEFCKNSLMRIALGWPDENDTQNVNSYVYDEIVKGTLPDWENFKYFYLSTDSIVIIFPPYQIGPFAFGQHEVKLSLEKLLKEFEMPSSFKMLASELQA